MINKMQHTTAIPNHGELKLVHGLPVDQVVRKIHEGHRTKDVGNRVLAFFLNEMEERKLFHHLGFSSAFHFARTSLCLSKTKIYELLQVGRRLRELGEIDERFLNNELSWSQVRLIVRVAEKTTEKAWIKEARESTLKDLALSVKRAEPGGAPKEKVGGLPESTTRIQSDVDAAFYEVWKTAKAGMGEVTGMGISDDQMIRLLTQLFVQKRLQQKNNQSVYKIVVTTCATCKTASVLTDDGKATVDKKALEQIQCNAEVIDLRSNPAPPEDKEGVDIDRPTPLWMRDRVLARDSNRCRCCGRKWSLNAHHIHFRGQGGKTEPSNLICLCAVCHSHIHEGLLTVNGNADEPVFINLRGERIHSVYEVDSGYG